MPSFEHTNQSKSQPQEDSLYQPGKNREKDPSDESEQTPEELIPTSQFVTRKGDVAAAAEMQAAEDAAKEAVRQEIANRSPRYIDAQYGDPSPTIQQSIRVKPTAAGPKKPGLRGRNRQASPAEAVKGGGSFGEVEKPTLSHETLSGNRIKDGKFEGAEQRERKPRAERPRQRDEKPMETTAEATSATPRTDEKPFEKKQERGPRPPKNNQPRKPQTQGETRRYEEKRERPDSRPQPAPKAEEPKGLFGKIKKALGGLFGNVPATPEKKPEPAREHQNRKPREGGDNRRPRNNNRSQNRHPSGKSPQQGGERQSRPQHQEEDGSPNNPRRRRGGRRRGGRNRNNRSNNGGPQSGQPQGGENA